MDSAGTHDSNPGCGIQLGFSKNREPAFPPRARCLFDLTSALTSNAEGCRSKNRWLRPASFPVVRPGPGRRELERNCFGRLYGPEAKQKRPETCSILRRPVAGTWGADRGRNPGAVARRYNRRPVRIQTLLVRRSTKDTNRPAQSFDPAWRLKPTRPHRPSTRGPAGRNARKSIYSFPAPPNRCAKHSGFSQPSFSPPGPRIVHAGAQTTARPRPFFKAPPTGS